MKARPFFARIILSLTQMKIFNKDLDPEKRYLSFDFKYFIPWNHSVRVNIIVHVYSSKNDVSRVCSWVVSITMITYKETCVAFHRRGREEEERWWLECTDDSVTLRPCTRTLMRGLIWWTRSWHLSLSFSLGSLGLWNIHNKVNYSIRKTEIETLLWHTTSLIDQPNSIESLCMYVPRV